jgi:hypothetical protein
MKPHARHVGRQKEWKTLDMVMVEMAEQDGYVRLVCPSKFLAKRDDARARVENDDLPARADLHTGSVAAKTDGVFPRRGMTPAHTPESHHEWFSHLRLRFKLHSYYLRRGIFFKEIFLTSRENFGKGRFWNADFSPLLTR